jgi:hypothetical protein
MPDAMVLSDAARALLRQHRERQGRIAVDDSNREAYRELARAGFMIAMRTFRDGRESHYKFTKEGWAAVDAPSPPESVAPRR